MDEREVQDILARLADLMEEVNEAQKRGKDVSKEVYDEMDKLKDKLKQATKETNDLKGAFNKLGRTATDLGRSMYRGDQGASSFNDSLDSLSSVLSGLVFAIPGLGKAAGIASVAIRGMSNYLQAAAEQGDTLYSSYQDLAKSGAATAGGLDQVFENLQKFTMGIEQLDQFTQMIANNRQELSKFAPTVGEATNQLGEIAAGITQTNLRREFMMLGYTVPEMNEAMVDYIALQSQVGMTQSRSTRQLTDSSEEYLKTVDALTRATGIQRDQLEENIIAARRDQQFRAKMLQLRNSGEEERAEQIERMFGLIAEEFPGAEKGLRSLITGFVVGEEATQLMVRTRGEALKQATDLAEGVTDPIQFVEDFVTSLGESANRDLVLGLTGSFDQAMGQFSEGADALNSAQGNLTERMKEAYLAQEDTTEQQNSLVGMSTDLRIAQMDTRDALQAMVQDGVAPATAMMESFAGVTRSVVELLETMPFIGREEGEQAAGANFLSGSTAGMDAIPESPSIMGSGKVEFSASGKTAYETQEGRVVGSLIDALKTKSTITAKDLFSGPGDPEGNTARRIVRGIPGVDLDTNLSERNEDTTLISALAQRYLGLDKHDEASAGRQYKDQVAEEISKQLEIGLDEISSYRTGGISTGPDSGYLSLMHGTEAVVPLPDGDSIPVSLSGLGNFENIIDGFTNNLGGTLNSFDNISSGFNNVMTYMTDINNMTNTFVDGIETLSNNMTSPVNDNSPNEQTQTLNRNLREQLRSIQDQTTKLDSLIRVSESNNSIMSKILQNSYA